MIGPSPAAPNQIVTRSLEGEKEQELLERGAHYESRQSARAVPPPDD